MKKFLISIVTLVVLSCCPETSHFTENIGDIKLTALSNNEIPSSEEIEYESLGLKLDLVPLKDIVLTKNRRTLFSPLELLYGMSCDSDKYLLEQNIEYIEVTCTESILGIESNFPIPYSKLDIVRSAGFETNSSITEWIEYENERFGTYTPLAESSIVLKINETFSHPNKLKFRIRLFYGDNSVFTSETDYLLISE